MLNSMSVTSTLIHAFSAKGWYINALRRKFPSFRAVGLLHLKSLIDVPVRQEWQANCISL
jgi:hypothetical protein